MVSTEILKSNDTSRIKYKSQIKEEEEEKKKQNKKTSLKVWEVNKRIRGRKMIVSIF
jgi:hypothetical protein